MKSIDVDLLLARENSLKRQAAFIAQMQCPLSDTSYYRPFAYAMRLAIKRNVNVCASVLSLLFHHRPPNVARLIISIIIDSGLAMNATDKMMAWAQILRVSKS